MKKLQKTVTIILISLIALSCQNCCPKESLDSQKIEEIVLNLQKKQLEDHLNMIEKINNAVVRISVYENMIGSKDAIYWGTGTIITKNGLILTAYHVVGSEDLILPGFTIVFRNGEEVVANIIYENKERDIALLEIDKETPNFLKFELSKKPKIGEIVIFIGNFEKLNSILVYGNIAKIDSNINFGKPLNYLDDYNVIISNIKIEQGFSGGALLNMEGKIIGISQAGTSQLLGPFPPISLNISESIMTDQFYSLIEPFILDNLKK